MSPIEPPRTHWHLVGLAHACAEIAGGALSGECVDEPAQQMGDIMLLPHQRDAVVRLRDALAEFHGALLADEVGLGKTFVAIAVSAGYRAAHVIAPAGLLPMWQRSLLRCGASNTSLHSLHACSARPPDIPGPDAGARTLVIVDEAHHLRNPATKRYRAVADSVVGHDVLLLSATPIHNRPRDLRAQLGLFTGGRNDLLQAAMLSRLVVRRTSLLTGRPDGNGAVNGRCASTAAQAQVGDRRSGHGGADRHVNGDVDRHVNGDVDRHVNRDLNRDVNRSVNGDVNRDVNGNVNRRVNTRVDRRVDRHVEKRVDALTGGHAHALASRVPRIVNHPPLAVSNDPAVLSAILALPAPLPARDGAIAGALIRLGLLRAWCSTDAALESVLVRRVLRASALRDALLEGRHPTMRELRAWLVGEHEVQLAFPTLVAGETAPLSDSASLIAQVDMHVDALNALRRHRRHDRLADNERAGHLRAILSSHPAVPVVAFSQFAETVRVLHRALSDIAGVGMLTASGGRIASGKVSRSDLLARFAPLAQGVPPPASHGAVKLLLSTDLLAEGVNLQDAGIVVHLDLPWTDALRQQRVGRVARLGSARLEVHVYRLASPHSAETALRQLERLREKAAHAEGLVGGASITHSAPDDASAVRAILQSWRRRLSGSPLSGTCDSGSRGSGTHVDDARTRGRSDVKDDERHAIVARVSCSRAGALLLVQSGRSAHLLACTTAMRSHELEQCSDSVGSIRSVLDLIGEGAKLARPPECEKLAALMAPVEALAGEWLATRAARTDAGAGPEALSFTQREAAERVHSVVASTSPLRRAAVLSHADRSLRVIHDARGDSAQRALRAWLSSFSAENSASWLREWSNSALLRSLSTAAAGGLERDSGSDASPAPWRVRAVILLLRPDVD